MFLFILILLGLKKAKGVPRNTVKPWPDILVLTLTKAKLPYEKYERVWINPAVNPNSKNEDLKNIEKTWTFEKMKTAKK